MDDYPSLYSIIYIIIFIFLNALMFGFGIAIQEVNSVLLEKNMEDGDRKAGRILKILNRPGKFINTVQLVSLLFGLITAGFFLNLNGMYAKVLALFLFLIINMIFGIIVPKRLAQKYPLRWLYFSITLIRFIMLLVSPVVAVVNFASALILKLFGIDISGREENVTEEDIMSMVNEGHEQGLLEHSEARMITNIFELNDKHASDIMTHRKNIVSIDGDHSLESVVDFMLTSGNNSRYPVYDKDIDNIIGIINMKDALIFLRKRSLKKKPVKNIRGLLRKANFIPETKSLDILFEEMQSKKIHMVVVIDEYGQTAGLVSLEDILEEIVGNIMDEYDVDEELIVFAQDGSCIIKGMTDLDDIEEALDIKFAEEEYDNFDTINGLMISRLGHIPVDNEEFSVFIHGYEFKALRVENRVISLISVVRHQEEETEKEEDGE